jgi:hypothetical protein
VADWWAGPLLQRHFLLFKDFQTDSDLNHSKYGILLLKNFKIKYKRVDNKIRNKFPYRSVSKFEIKFELKIREPN